MKQFVLFLVATTIILLSLGNTYVQAQSPLKLDSVSRNNQGAKIFEGPKVYGQNGDAIRVAGTTTAGEKVIVYFNNNEYRATADSFGNWFVLFSIINPTESSYIIEASSSGNPRIKLLTLEIGKEPVEESENEKDDSKIDTGKIFDIRNIIIILLSVVVIILGWLLISPKLMNKKTK